MATRVRQRSTNKNHTTTPRTTKRKELQLRTPNNVKQARLNDDEILSESDHEQTDELFLDDTDNNQIDNTVSNISDSDNEYEDADHARIRIAKQYLQSVKSSIVDTGIDDTELTADHDVDTDNDDRHGITASDDYINAKINEKLQSDLAVQQRRHTISIGASLHRDVADLTNIKHATHSLKGHSKAVTSCALSNKYIVSGSLDGSVSYYDIHTKHRIHTFKRAKHTGELGHHSGVLTCDITSDSNYIATAGYDNNIHVWDTRSNTLAQKLVACHRDTITSVRFSVENNELYSASYDRTVKVYNCAVNADIDDNEQVLNYLDTLYGHTSHVTSLCTLQSTHVLSGGNDKSLRMFNKEKQTQLLYKGSNSSIDCVSMFNDHTYITGNQAGQIQLWNSNKKKPLQTVDNAHTTDNIDINNHIMTNNTQCNWITAVAALPFSDIAISGSSNNTLNFYQLAENKRSIALINTMPIHGIVNDIQFSTDGRYVGIAVGRDYKLGRWFTAMPNCAAKNEVVLVDLVNLGVTDATKHGNEIVADTPSNGIDVDNR